MTKPITPAELTDRYAASLAPESIAAMNELLVSKWFSPGQYAIIYVDEFVALVREKLGISDARQPLPKGIVDSDQVIKCFIDAGWIVEYSPYQGSDWGDSGSSKAFWKFLKTKKAG